MAQTLLRLRANKGRKIMNHRYRVEVRSGNISVVDTQLFTAISRNGVTVLYIGCGNNSAKLSANLQRVVSEYSVAPQNIKFV
jgi:hypothetical protein